MDNYTQGEILQAEEPQQPQPANSPVYDMMQEERVASFIEQTSPVKNLQNINNILKGIIYDTEKKEWVQIADPIPNKIRNDFLQRLTPHLSNNARMSRLDTNQISAIMKALWEWVSDYLDINADEHNLSETQMTKIGDILLDAVFYTILRSQEGVERSKIFSSLKMGETFSPQQKPDNPAWYKFWK